MFPLYCTEHPLNNLFFIRFCIVRIGMTLPVSRSEDPSWQLHRRAKPGQAGTWLCSLGIIYFDWHEDWQHGSRWNCRLSGRQQNNAPLSISSEHLGPSRSLSFELVAVFPSLKNPKETNPAEKGRVDRLSVEIQSGDSSVHVKSRIGKKTGRAMPGSLQQRWATVHSFVIT